MKQIQNQASTSIIYIRTRVLRDREDEHFVCLNNELI